MAPDSLRRVGYLLVAVLAVVLGSRAHAGPSPQANEPGGTFTIGAKNFTESRILAEITAQLVEARTDLQVERRWNLGGTTVLFSALQSGQIDLYPEYTGTGWAIHLGREDRAGDALQTYVLVRRTLARRDDLHLLEPYGFENAYALAVRQDYAEAHALRRVSDLAGVQGEVRLALSHEFLERADGFPGLAEAYDLDIGEVRGTEHGLAYQAIGDGKVDLIDTYTTDGRLVDYDLVLLEDDQGFFPPYDAAPLVRGKTLEAHPELGVVLGALAFRIDDERMQALNHAVEQEQEPFEVVARRFLEEEGLLDGELDPLDTAPDRSGGLLAFLWSRRAETVSLTARHLLLSIGGVVLAVLLAVPLGLALSRRPRPAGIALAATGVVQTIPSLALMAMMIPVPGLGLGARSAVAALFLYALLPILRNTIAGVREVDPELIEAARAMGMTDRQILARVELPLAIRTIMAGVRTAAVVSVGVATLAAFVGAGGLGDPILTGLQLNDPMLVLAGAIPAAVLALLVDGLLAVAERGLTPLGLRRRDAR